MSNCHNSQVNNIQIGGRSAFRLLPILLPMWLTIATAEKQLWNGTPGHFHQQTTVDNLPRATDLKAGARR